MGYYVASVGAVGVLVLAMLEVDYFWIANALYLSFVVGDDRRFDRQAGRLSQGLLTMVQAHRVTNRIRALRFDAGEMTQADLADRLGVTRQTVIAIEQGKYSPSLEMAFQIARVFGVPLDDVFQYPKEGRPMISLARSADSPKQLARIARSSLSPSRAILTGFSGTALPRLYVAGDAAATAGNLAASAATVRYAVVANLAGASVWVLLALALYLLLGGISAGAARAMVVFTALGAGIMMLNAVFAFEAMRVATGAVDLTALGAGNSSATALLLPTRITTERSSHRCSSACGWSRWAISPAGRRACCRTGWASCSSRAPPTTWSSTSSPPSWCRSSAARSLVITIPPIIAEVSAVVYLLAVGVRASQPVGHLPAEA